jgi:ketosteroid isomerase-like protein
MSEANKALARAFFAGLNAGNLPDDLLAPDMRAWTTSSGTWTDRARYQGGVRLLQSLFAQGLAYTVTSLTAEDDRVAAEVTAAGVLSTGEDFANTYVFVLRVANDATRPRIASVAEHFNPIPVREQLGPLIQIALQAAAAR